MTQPSTPTPTLQALIDLWSRSNDVLVDGPTARVCAQQLERALQAHPVVPLDELQAAFDAHEVGTLIAKYAPQPPNPHPQGTYLWAREEQDRNRTVRRRAWNGEACVPGCNRWEAVVFHHADFTATDWEVVS